MECHFTVGQKVVCISYGRIGKTGKDIGGFPEKGSIYTIREIIPDIPFVIHDGTIIKTVALKFHEIVRVFQYHSGAIHTDYGFVHTYFKPLVEDNIEDSEVILLFRRIADGVTKGQLLIPDPLSEKIKQPVHVR